MMERSDALAKQDGFTSLITMESWMFLSSFEKLRDKINDLKTIVNMVHMPYLGKGGTSLGINFGTAAVVMKKDILQIIQRSMSIRFITNAMMMECLWYS